MRSIFVIHGTSWLLNLDQKAILQLTNSRTAHQFKQQEETCGHRVFISLENLY
uniref:Uncharacterized protein n=1 Tax=Arundo donax TaxID=35708 RepID=A0A0A9BPP5_ARUDO